MSWISKHLSKEDINKIEETISRVEAHTSGEIVPVIVRRSSSVGHIPLMLTLLLTLVVVLVELPFSDWLWVRPWAWLWPVLVVLIYFISAFLGKIPWVQKVLVPEADELKQVHQRAHLEFYLNRLNRTEAGTGILIFVSVMEKKAVILADEGISKKLPPETWQHILTPMRSLLHKDQWGDGFVKAIESCGELLKTHFPISENDRNELKNNLVIKE